MLENNVLRIIKKLNKNDLVLDIGGWAQPFNRADYVVDIHPYETRGFFGSQGGGRECFSKKTWILHDVSSRKKLPFKNNQFDFVICSHTLEDIRDPIFLCSEIMRVGKRGYIEVPSERSELIKGIANNKYCGYYHHRWLIEVKDDTIKFRFKPHNIHNDWRFHLPKSFVKKLPLDKRISYLFWENKFDYFEIIQISRDKVEDHIGRIVRREEAYSEIRYLLYKLKSRILKIISRIKLILNPNLYYHKYMDTEEYISK